jgi:hypothetical protein
LALFAWLAGAGGEAPGCCWACKGRGNSSKQDIAAAKTIRIRNFIVE